MSREPKALLAATPATSRFTWSDRSRVLYVPRPFLVAVVCNVKEVFVGCGDGVAPTLS